MVAEKKIPIIYLVVYRRLKCKCHGDIILYQTIMETLNRSFPLSPRVFNFEIIKEFEHYGLLERVDKKTYRIKKCNKCKVLDKYDYPLW